MFLCYTYAPSEAKVSLTENISMHACGGELDGSYTFQRSLIGFKFSCVEFGEVLKISRLLISNTIQQNIVSVYAEYSLNVKLLFTPVFAPRTVPFGETNQTSCVLYFFYSTS